MDRRNRAPPNGSRRPEGGGKPEGQSDLASVEAAASDRKAAEDAFTAAAEAALDSVGATEDVRRARREATAERLPSDAKLDDVVDDVAPARPDWLVNDWSKPPPARQWLADGWFPAHRVAILTGAGGGGKTKLALMLAHAVATGGDRWFDGGPQIGARGSVLFASWEDERDEFARRLLQCPDYRFDGAAALHEAVGDRIDFADLMGRGPLWTVDNVDGGPTELGFDVQSAAANRAARLLVIDAVDSAFAGNENDRAHVRPFISHWDAWAMKARCTVLLIAHPPKSEAVYSGSTAWRNACRAMLVLTREPGAEQATLAVDKLNYGERPADLALADWRWWRATTPDPRKAASTLDRELQADVLRVIEEADEPLSQRAVFDRYRASGGNASHDRIRAALTALEMDGRAVTRTGPRRSKLYGVTAK